MWELIEIRRAHAWEFIETRMGVHSRDAFKSTACTAWKQSTDERVPVVPACPAVCHARATAPISDAAPAGD